MNITELINEIAHEVPLVAQELQGCNIYSFTDQELLTLIKIILQDHITHISPNNIEKLMKAQSTIIEALRKYKVSGYSFCIDPNVAFIWDNQNPLLKVYYKNDSGQIKQRRYQASINSIGLKFELAIKFNFIFFVNTDFNFYDSDKVIEFDSGIDLSIGIFAITYASFKYIPGGILIIGCPIPGTLTLLSIVTGGSLTPLCSTQDMCK
jgi:hypothetical protein